MTWDTIFKYCLRCALGYERNVYRDKLRVFLLFFQKFWYFHLTEYFWHNARKDLTFSVDCVKVSNFCQITIRVALFSVKFSVENFFCWITVILFHYLLKICSVNDAVELTVNQFQQNISNKLADDYLSTILTGNVVKFPVDLTKIFNSVFRR